MTELTSLPDEIKRWTAPRRATLVLQLLRGETTVAKAARQYGLTPAEIEQWQHAFLDAGTNGLKTNPGEELDQREKKIEQLHRKIGEMTMDLEVLQMANSMLQEAQSSRSVSAALFGQGSASDD